MSDIQQLLSALEVFSSAPDKAAIERANAWLQDFQHSPDAWVTCTMLLNEPNAPQAAKTFAAQTFRTKIIYDLEQVDPPNLMALRDTLTTTLNLYPNGPRNIIVQLCLAIAGFALQVPTWENAVEDMIERFGQNPVTVPLLLQFLTILPEELYSNSRIPITDAEFSERASRLLSSNAENVLQVLNMYVNASGVSQVIQAQVFKCLRSWVAYGEIATSALAQTALFEYSFEALSSEQLFDEAVEVVCSLIHETQEIEENMDVIQRIFPKVIALRSQLAAHADDPERIKGLAHIFTEAGETYRMLLVRHTEEFQPLLEAIAECSAYTDTDVVEITFPFWGRFAELIVERDALKPLFIDAYKALMTVIIRQLHFPSDTEQVTGQEMDTFRSFRHIMGDTLKDCCYVIGTEQCLLAACEMVTVALANSTGSWQEIEAPLFSMRSMGATVDPSENVAVPKVMALIPRLPAHPRVRYAALLIVSRYTEWIAAHPDYVAPQLQYISQGFEDSDAEVNAAAGQALRYLCQDCKQHLTAFVPQLHAFVTTMGPKLNQDDKVQVYEAVAHVISAMPMDQAATSLQTFATDLLAQVHALVAQGTPATTQQLKQVSYDLENLEAMLHVIRSFGDVLPAACVNSCKAGWAVFDPFLAKYGTNYDISERSTRVFRHAITLFGSSVLEIAPSLLQRLSSGFAETGFPGYLWIGGKIINAFGVDKNADLHAAILDMYAHSTHKVALLLKEKTPGNIPDVLEDYLQMIKQILEHTPDIFFESPAFSVIFFPLLGALTVVQTDVIWASLEVIRTILTHNCLEPQPNPPPKFPVFATAISQAIEKNGFDLVSLLLSGIVNQFPEESISTVVTSIRVIAALWPAQLLQWLPRALQDLTSAPAQAKTQFMEEITSAMSAGQLDKVRYAVLGFNRASRKARERRRTGAMDD